MGKRIARLIIKTKSKIIFISSLCASLFGIIIGLGIANSITNSSNVENNMITLLSIIVTLGVAYSFYSIYRVSNEFDQLKTKTDSIKRQLKKETSNLTNSIAVQTKILSEQARAVDKRLELYRMTLNTANNFNNRRFLMVLKNELETLVFVLSNASYLSGELLDSANEVESSIGAKRAHLANDILICVQTLTNSKIEKFAVGEYDNTKKYITKAINEICNERLFSKIHINEQQRYLFLFNIIQKLLILIDGSLLPMSLSEKEIIKLQFYNSGILDGSKSDFDLRYEEWASNYKKRIVESESEEQSQQFFFQ